MTHGFYSGEKPFRRDPRSRLQQARRLPAILTSLLALWIAAMPGTGSAEEASAPSTERKVLYSCPNLAELSPLSPVAVRMFEGYDGWFFRSLDFESDFVLPPSVFDFYTRLNAALDRKGIRLVIMPLPPRSLALANEVPPEVAEATNFDPKSMRRSFADFLESLRASGALVVDTARSLDDPDIESFYFKRDIHWRPEGARKTAAAVRQTLEDDGSFAGLSNKAFTNRIVDERASLYSGVQLALSSMCRHDIPKEYRPLFETTNGGATVDDFLGGEEERVPVALVGTSFTDEKTLFNFTGFLREALGMEVASYAISGGNIDQSIYRFLHSDASDDRATSYLIWELPFPGRIEEIPDNLVRQLVPAAEGVCENDRVVQDEAYEIAGPGPVVLEVAAGERASGNGYYVVMTLSDPSIRNFVAFLRYDDGREEVFTVARPDRVAATDKLFIELSPEFSGSLREVEVDPLDGSALSGNIKLCRASATRSAELGG